MVFTDKKFSTGLWFFIFNQTLIKNGPWDSLTVVNGSFRLIYTCFTFYHQTLIKTICRTMTDNFYSITGPQLGKLYPRHYSLYDPPLCSAAGNAIKGNSWFDSKFRFSGNSAVEKCRGGGHLGYFP